MIYLPPPQPAINSDIRLHGDVEIHPTASIAPGVILQAAPNSRIVIGADVCVGMGTILHAYQGSIEIESGATLGSGVLVLGESKIGSNACVGTATTIFQASVSAMSVVNPGSIIGDVSRQVDLTATQQHETREQKSDRASKKNNSFGAGSPSTNGNQPSKRQNNSVDKESLSNKNTSSSEGQNPTGADTDIEVETVKSNPEKKKDSVVGQVYINQLLVTLFPHKQKLDSNSVNNQNDT